MAENDDRAPPGDHRAGGDQLRERIARARESIGRSLRDAAAAVEHDEEALRTRAGEELARIAGAELGRSVVELTAATDELVAKRLSEALDRLSAEAASRNREQLAEVRRIVRAERATAPPATSRRERRHELKLARAESSRRVSRALTRLERRGGTLIGELDARARLAGERIEVALRRVEEAAGGAGESRVRLAAIEAKALASASRAATSAELAFHARELESRLRDAVRREAEAASRMAAAERRLLALVRS